MKFRFTKDGQSISQAEFVRNVPTDWVNHLDEFGCFSWGYFSASLIDKDLLTTDGLYKVKAIVGSFDYDEDPYAECRRIKAELNSVGWDCDYGLDGVIHAVKPLTI